MQRNRFVRFLLIFYRIFFGLSIEEEKDEQVYD